MGEDRRASARVDWLDSLRGAAIVMVVAMHTAPYVPIYESSHAAIVYILINSIAVSTFFLVDGYLFASLGARRELQYRSFLLRSARRLLLPWVCFSLGYLALRALAEVAGWEGPRSVLAAPVRELVTMVIMSEVSAQLYFLPSLFLVRCLAPATARLASRSAGVGLCVFLAYTALYRGWLGPAYKAAFPDAGLDPLLHALWGLQFYLLGISLVKLRPLFEHGWAVVAAGVLTAVTALWFEVGPRFVGIYGYLLAASFLFYQLGPRAGPLVGLGRETMGIYLLHTPVPTRFFSLLAPRVGGDVLVQFLLVVATSLAASLALTVGLRRTRVGRFLFGE